MINESKKNSIEDGAPKEEKEYVIKNYRLIYQKKRDFYLPTANKS
jgi:hypothetical protein